MKIINMKTINELQKKRKKYIVKAIIFTLVIPSPGIVIESLCEAKKADDEILKEINNPVDIDDDGERVIICKSDKR